MKKLITAVLGGTAVATLAFASASVLAVDGGTIQAGQDGSLYCDVDGVEASWGLETDDNSVRWVDIEGIDEACLGAQMFVKVNNGPTRAVTISGPEARFNFTAPFPTAQSIEDLKIWIEG